MNAIVEIDKAGRIVIPKRFRDALGLRPGTRLRVEQLGELLRLTATGEEAEITIVNGLPLIVPAGAAREQAVTTAAVNGLIAQGYRERERRFLGLDDEALEAAS